MKDFMEFAPYFQVRSARALKLGDRINMHAEGNQSLIISVSGGMQRVNAATSFLCMIYYHLGVRMKSVGGL